MSDDLKEAYKKALFKFEARMREIIAVTETEQNPKEALNKIWDLAADALAD